MIRFRQTLVLKMMTFMAMCSGFTHHTQAASPEELWDQIIKTHLNPEGRVNYPLLRENKDQLDQFLRTYKETQPSKWDQKTRKAKYINLYNATMMWSMLRYAHENKIDLNSKEFTQLRINKLKTKKGNIWNGEYRVQIAGKYLNLDEIEHGLLRRDNGQKVPDSWRVSELDPRIHAAVNCAALSCPPVASKAYTTNNVDDMLNENMSKFVNNSKQFSMKNSGTLNANSIVLWYYDDFDSFAQKVLRLKGAGEYLAKFIASGDRHSKIKAHLLKNFNDRSKIALRLSGAFNFDYNWVVNDQRNEL